MSFQTGQSQAQDWMNKRLRTPPQPKAQPDPQAQRWMQNYRPPPAPTSQPGLQRTQYGIGTGVSPNLYGNPYGIPSTPHINPYTVRPQQDIWSQYGLTRTPAATPGSSQYGNPYGNPWGVVPKPQTGLQWTPYGYGAGQPYAPAKPWSWWNTPILNQLAGDSYFTGAGAPRWNQPPQYPTVPPLQDKEARTPVSAPYTPYPWVDYGGGGGGGGGSSYNSSYTPPQTYMPAWYTRLLSWNVNRG